MERNHPTVFSNGISFLSEEMEEGKQIKVLWWESSRSGSPSNIPQVQEHFCLSQNEAVISCMVTMDPSSKCVAWEDYQSSSRNEMQQPSQENSIYCTNMTTMVWMTMRWAELDLSFYITSNSSIHSFIHPNNPTHAIADTIPLIIYPISLSLPTTITHPLFSHDVSSPQQNPHTKAPWYEQRLRAATSSSPQPGERHDAMAHPTHKNHALLIRLSPWQPTTVLPLLSMHCETVWPALWPFQLKCLQPISDLPFGLFFLAVECRHVHGHCKWNRQMEQTCNGQYWIREQKWLWHTHSGTYCSHSVTHLTSQSVRYWQSNAASGFVIQSLSQLVS